VTKGSTFDVAVVGGGASGTLLAVQLLRRAPAGFRLLLLDRAGDFARGIAYRSLEATHLLNVPAGRMSALADEEGHFLEWLRAVDRSAGPETYAARRRYGDYLEELLQRTQEAAKGVLLERRKAEVRGAEEVEEGVRLQCRPGPDVVARHAVLALGNPAPALLPVSSAAPGVWQSPWPREGAWPEKDAAVLLVGAGLTAVDWVLALSARGHLGPMHLLSRHGLLPLSHRTPSEKALVLEGLPVGRIRPLVRALREAAQAAPDWRTAVDAVRPLAHALWRGLNDEERRRFSRHVRTHWEVHRHRLAPAVAQVVADVLSRGQLHVHAGRLLGLEGAAGRISARYRPRGEKKEARLLVDVAINCTGPAGHSLHADALVASLLRAGQARPGPLGLGLGTDERGALLDVRGKPSRRLWTLGPVRRGDTWESTAVPDIRLQAAALALAILD
jgi:uncharacterized NAD(P)/FAD-binding protein YdhS